MSTVIVDYGSGNLRSVARAVERVARESGVGAPVAVTGNPVDVAAADRIILPGVGAFGDCRAGLDAIPGMMQALQEAVIERGRPFLGICVGMQLMADRGLEYGETAGLGWIAGEVDALAPDDPNLKIPHMGWNRLVLRKPHPVLADIRDGEHAYFVHGYGFRPTDPDRVLAETDYGGAITAAIGRDNLVGTQFHPEKSQEVGLRLLGGFLRWQP